jgi:hypothetical protein
MNWGGDGSSPFTEASAEQHCGHDILSLAVTKNRTTILPLPAGEGWGEGESLGRRCSTQFTERV